MESPRPSEWLLVLSTESVVFSALALAAGTFDFQRWGGVWIPLLSAASVGVGGCSLLALFAVLIEFMANELPGSRILLIATKTIDTVCRRLATVLTIHAIIAWCVLLLKNKNFCYGLWLQGNVDMEQRNLILNLQSVVVLVLILISTLCLLAARRGRQDYPNLPSGTQLSCVLFLILASEIMTEKMFTRAMDESGMAQNEVTPLQLYKNKIFIENSMDIFLYLLLVLASVVVANALSSFVARSLPQPAKFIFFMSIPASADQVLLVSVLLAALGPAILLTMSLIWLIPFTGTAAGIVTICLLSAFLLFGRVNDLYYNYQVGKQAFIKQELELNDSMFGIDLKLANMHSTAFVNAKKHA